ncbi:MULTISPECIES: CHC2 zinc finger domain-containing protein [Jannaschia]|uniref:CHC2 zinc finger domain-containing protein n=1 Tax=Jannaschia TaxID=188905 RepID=UPI001C7DCB48|nr:MULTISPECIES: CHC2 zinc finger domain-containing protein [unclassified Jannaschia]
MSTFIDFDAVKAANPIETVAKRLGLDLKKAGASLRGPCPSGEGGPRALAITPSKGLWYSFGLQKGGDVIELVALVNGCSTKDAAHFLSGTVPLEKANRSSPEGTERGFRPLDYLEPDHQAVLALGIEPEDASALGIGYAPRGILRGTVAVPIRTEDGALAGYIGITEATLPPRWEI